MGGMKRSRLLLFKSAVGLISSVLVLITGSVAIGASFDPDRLERPLGHVSVQVTEPGSIFNFSKLSSHNGERRPDGNILEIDCTSTKDPKCDLANPALQIWGRMILPICESAAQDNCVEKLALFREGVEFKADFVKQADGGLKFLPDPSNGFLGGGSPLIFSVPGLLHGGGTDQYSLAVAAGISYNRQSKSFETNDLVASVVPTSIQRDDVFRTDRMGSGANNACAFVEEGVCGVREDFPSEISIQVSIRLPNSVGGWFMGRLQDPEVTISKFSPQNNLLTIKAKPVTVSRFAVPREPNSLTDAEKALMPANWGSYGGLSRGVLADTPSAFRALAYYRAEAKDKAAGTNSLWSFRTIRAGQGSPCLADTSKLQGIVTTNSTVYSGLAPSFESGSLNYQVAGLHYMQDGKSLSLGSYDLVMNSDTARCLYGFTNAPISATIQVVGTGDQNVTTTVVSEKDGWLKLAAYGFTFSEKEIKVTLGQPFKRTISKFAGTTKTLTSKQKSEIRSAVMNSKWNSKFTCTGYFLNGSSKTTALVRARAVCNYAKGLDSNLIYAASAEQTKVKLNDAKVMLVSE
jgi:hypothetical protein